MVLGDSGEAADLVPMSTDKKKKATLFPWDLPAAKLLRSGKKSSLEDATSYEELWSHLCSGNKHQEYGSELCSNDSLIRGVAISRYAEAWLSLCTAILETDNVELKSVLNPSIYAAMETEAKALKPHLAMLNGAGLPVRADAMKKSQLGGGKTYTWKVQTDVEASMRYVMDWTKKPSSMRKTVRILQLGGLFYTAHVDHLCFHAYRTVGHGTDESIPPADAVARLCQARGSTAAGTAIRSD